MASKVDDLLVEVKADVSDLLKKLGIAQDSTKSTTERMKASFGALSSGIGAATKALGTYGLAVDGAKAALAPFEAMLERLNSNAGILRTAKNLGVSTQKFQEFTFAARNFGANSEDVYDVIKDFGIRVGEAAEGSESMVTALDRIGLSAEELIRLSPEDQFYALADAVKKSEDGLARLSLDELVSDPGIRMINVLKNGSLGLEDMAGEARELNQVLSETDLRAMEEAAKSVEKLKMGFEGLMNEVLIHMAPLLEKVLDGAIEGIKQVNKMLGILVTLEDKEAKLVELQALQAKYAKDKEGVGRLRLIAIQQEKKIEEEILELTRQINDEKDKMMDTGKMFGPFQSEDDTPSSFNMQEEYNKKYGDEEEDEEEKKKNLDMGYGVYGPEEFEDLMSRNFEQFARLEEQRKAFLDRELGDHEEQFRKMQWLWDSGYQGKLKIASDFFNNLLTMTQGRSRKMFEFTKALGIAEATISTFKGGAKALELPYPYNLIAMAQVVGTGLAQVSKIQSVQFGGGGGGAGGGASSPASASSEALQDAGVGTSQTTNVDVTLQGDSFSGEQIRGLIGSINEATSDNVKLNAVMTV
jgi:hypothetical protein